MKAFLEEYGMLIVEFLIGAALLFLLFSSTINSNDAKDAAVPQLMSVTAGDNGMLAAMGKPLLEVNHATITRGDAFIPENYIVKAEDAQGGDLKSFVKVDASKVNVNVAGVYEAYYSVKDTNGLVSKVTINVTVMNNDPLEPTSKYD